MTSGTRGYQQTDSEAIEIRFFSRKGEQVQGLVEWGSIPAIVTTLAAVLLALFGGTISEWIDFLLGLV
jgi:hypothetical protein